MYAVQFFRDNDFVVVFLIILIVLYRIRQNEDHNAVVVTEILFKPFNHACRHYVEVTVSAQIKLHIFLCAEHIAEQVVQLFLYIKVLDDTMTDHTDTVYLTKQIAYHLPSLYKKVHLNTKA